MDQETTKTAKERIFRERIRTVAAICSVLIQFTSLMFIIIQLH